MDGTVYLVQVYPPGIPCTGTRVLVLVIVLNLVLVLVK
jgi:hypothetical protein